MDTVIRFPQLLHQALILRGAGDQEATFIAARVTELLGIDLALDPTGGIPPPAFFAIAKALFTTGPENHPAAGKLVDFAFQRLRQLHGLSIQEIQQSLAKFQSN